MRRAVPDWLFLYLLTLAIIGAFVLVMLGIAWFALHVSLATYFLTFAVLVLFVYLPLMFYMARS